MSDPLKISVAMCTYNGEKYIVEQLKSIWGQTRRPDEVIICDDCSSDATVQAVEKFLAGQESGASGSIPVRFYAGEKNLGVVGNFTKALKFCTGDIIFPCDQDDIWLPEKIAVFEKLFLEQPDCSVLFSNAELVDASGRALGRTLWESLDFSPGVVGTKYKNMLRLLLNRCVVTGTAMAFRRSLLKEVLPLSQNWIHDGWIAVIAACTGKILPVDQCLLLYRQHENNVVGANEQDLLSRSKRYVGNFSRMEQIRLKRKYRYEDVLARLKELNRLPSDDDLKELQNCIAFWSHMLELERSGLFKGLGAILSELFSSGYHKYYSGLKGAVRDTLCLMPIHGKNG